MKPFFTLFLISVMFTAQLHAGDGKFTPSDLAYNYVTIQLNGFSALTTNYVNGNRSRKEFAMDVSSIPADSVYSTELLFHDYELQGKLPENLLMLKTTAGTDAEITNSNTVIVVPKISVSGTKTTFTGAFTGTGRLYLIENTFILPIYGFSIEAYIAKNAAIINWRTETEVESKYFEVEHSMDGLRFQPLFQRPASLNSNVPLNYSWTHENPLPGINFYRIKEVSISGQVSYSQIALVKKDAAAAIKIYPNPVHDVFTIDYQMIDNPTVQIVNMTGNIVKTICCKGTNGILKVNATDLPNGMYVLMVMENGLKIKVEKLIKY